MRLGYNCYTLFVIKNTLSKMIQNDRQRTNSTVNEILLVREKLVTPKIQVIDLIVSGSAIVIGPVLFNDLKINTITATTVTATNVVATNLIAFRAFLTDTIDQLVLGTGNTITVTAPTPSSSHTYTIPDVGSNSSFVMTDGAQTINGIKTFTSTPVFPGLSLGSLTLTNTSNQLTLGTGQTITLNAPTPAASRTYTTPDVGANASFILSEGVQTINGAKTFGSATIFNTSITLPTPGGSASPLNFYQTFSGTLDYSSGAYVGVFTKNVYLTRIGNIVTMTLEGGTKLVTIAVPSIITSTAIPAQFRPVQLFQAPVTLVDNGAPVLGFLDFFNGDGTFNLASGINGIFVANKVSPLAYGTSGNIGLISNTLSWIAA